MRILIILSVFMVFSCGVKGPPLPPVVATPQESEAKTFLPDVTPIPSPTASPAPVIKKKKKKGST